MAINFGNFGKTGTYETFVSRMVDNQIQFIREDNSSEKKRNNIFEMEYLTASDHEMEIKVCPEPSFFLKEITKYDTSSKKQEAFVEFAKKIEETVVEKPNNNIWFNKTANGINIRLGNRDGDTGNQEPAILGDDCVHGVVVGRTGAGKSVLINNIILNLITEYAPWELDLFLVDMKKVELSRYMTNADDGSFMTPHISACGATSEVRYIVSIIQYLSDCMKARQALFAALRVQKIKDFREKYSKEFGVDFVLPRILLLVDEFQQMFLEASGKERKILDECITAITKLGRATGVHLLFASQEMSGALGSKELANFKLRIALPCDAAISEQILGNSAASKIEEKGITLVNKKGGSKEEDNILYRTPFIDDKEGEDGSASEFQRYLLEIHNTSAVSRFKKVQKFYQEDTQEKIEKISDKMGDSLALETADQGFGTAIATAHGGYVDGSKDTIHAMNIVDESYDSVQVRCKLLAAILRFADEISDDLGRAAPPEIPIPAANQAYHEYSKALVPVSIEGDTIKFQFRVPYDLTQKKIGKNGKKVYLYDEILNRLAKCMRELEYCKKYAYGMIRLTTLNVVIGFLKQGSSHQIQESVALRLTLQGYPDETRSSISDYLDAGLPGTANGLKFKDGKAVRAAMSLK